MSDMTQAEVASTLGPVPAPVGLKARLDRARTELLDLSTRNRLLNTPRGTKAKQVEVIDELSSEVYRLLVVEARALTFAPGRRAASQAAAALAEPEDPFGEIAELAQPDDDTVDGRGVLARHSDTRLQARLTSEGLQARLLTLHLDARTLQEEQGVNVLYLALGMLRWFEDDRSEKERHAPLILLPVALERGTAAERFKLRWLQEEPRPNLSLAELLKRQFGLKLPDFTDGGEEFDAATYFSAVARAVSGQPRWSVLENEIVLGFFSFAKFLMYQDLDPDTWPAGQGLADHPILTALLGDGFSGGEALIGEDEPIDPHIPPEDLVHVVDADSSQTLAVHEVRQGRTLVIQGPPGTGKSQTIANIIAAAVHDGKKVLFVAEKMAALEVVKRRLDSSGIGDICLELHSNKTNKRGFLEEVRRTWDLGRPQGADDATLLRQLRQARDTLNGHATRLHRRHRPSDLTPYQVRGHLVRLRQAGQPPARAVLEKPESWSRAEREERMLLLTDLAGRIGDIGPPRQHPWFGARIDTITPMDLERLTGRLSALAQDLAGFLESRDRLAALLGMAVPDTAAGVADVAGMGRRLAAAPDLDQAAIADEVWLHRPADIEALVATGERLAALLAGMQGTVSPQALSLDPAQAREALATFGTGWLRLREPAVQALRGALASLLAEAGALQQALGTGFPATRAGFGRLVRLVAAVETAPMLEPGALTAPAWAGRPADIADLIAAGRALATARRELAPLVTESAWDTDLRQARQHIATHGKSWLRFLNGDYKRAMVLFRSILVGEPPTSVDEQVKLLDRLIAARKQADRLAQDDALGREAFGSLWRRETSDWEALSAVQDWVAGLGDADLSREGRRLAATGLPAGTAAQARRLGAALPELETALSALLDDLGQRAPRAFPAQPFTGRDLPGLLADLDRLDHACTLLSALFTTPPDSLAGQQQVLDRLGQALDCIGLLTRNGPDGQTGLGERAFGRHWAGDRCDWPRLRAILEWVAGNGPPERATLLRHMAARVADRAAAGALGEGLLAARTPLLTDVAGVFTAIDLDRVAVFGTDDPAALDLSALRDRLALWLERHEDLTKWTAYTAKARHARALGLGQLVDGLEDGWLDPGTVLPEFEMACYEPLFDIMVQQDPELGRFDGDGHGRTVQEFGRLDRKRLHLARREVAARHHAGLPRSDGGAGPVAVLRGEMAKRRNHMAIRQLMKRAGPAIQAIKPVFMMSPLSVAQFLEPGAVTFDLLVVDEASQIQPVDAFGAIARCRQIVVVGDDRQLPPTRFFDKVMAGTEDSEEEADARMGDVESILGLCESKGLPRRMLRWHYRSRHQSLIAVSNSQFYENKLFVVPSPWTAEAGMGLRFHHLPHCVYDRGGTATNVEEAKLVAQAIIRHAREHPGLSLGVATFSTKQRRAIVDEMERLRRLNPETEPFFNAHPHEPFFIKNLENVQGDERDVIFISVGYGRDASGYMAMGFGPLSRDGGERRLNVLISRAKRRCEVFSAITDEDIDLERARSKGVFAFKLFLHFARTGNLSFGQRTGGEHDSVFEEQVAKALVAHGYTVHAQVGLAGFFIDLAIADAERPGRYILGIECDGAAYHSSRSARDRDRLRQAVLEDHGWIIHRIWSTDWFNRPQEQLARVIAAIAAAKEELAAREGRAELAARAVPVEIVTVEREVVTEIGLVPTGEAGSPRGPALATPYQEASFPVPGHLELHEVPYGLMADLVRQVVAVEGPVHGDEIVARLRTLWGLQRAGSRIRNAVLAGAGVAVKLGTVRAEGDFYTLPDTPVPVRDRSAVTATGLRKPDMLPPGEIQEAARRFVEAHLGATEEEAITGVARLLGFQSTSSQLRDLIGRAVAASVSAGVLVRQGELLRLG